MRVKPEEELFITLFWLETLLWRPETRSSRKTMETILAEDFREIGRSGRIWKRDEMFGHYSVIDVVLPLPDMQVKLLDSGQALLTYTSIVGGGCAAEYSRRSSIWSLQGGTWKLRFHQGTPYVPDARKDY